MKLSVSSAAFLLVSGLSRGTAFIPSSLSSRNPSTSLSAERPIVIGAGVGGVASACVLKDAGLDPVLLDQCSQEKLLSGAGINLQILAIEALNSLGIETETLKEAGCPISKQSYYTPDGRRVGSLDKKGRDGIPGQIGIHRGELITLLLDHARTKGIDVRLQHRVTAIFGNDPTSTESIIVRTQDQTKEEFESVLLEGNVLIGADGINSRIRRHYINGNGDEDPRFYHGHTHYRGVCDSFPSILNGETMILAGGLKGVKAVVYPIGHLKDGKQRINWVLAVDDHATTDDDPTEYLKGLLAANKFDLGFLDVDALVTQTPEIQSYPMTDLNPLSTWTESRIGLIGDAAHGMLPVGSGGAMAALFDAVALGKAFQNTDTNSYSENLRTYEATRFKDASAHQARCRLQPAESIVQEAMDTIPWGEEIPAEYEDRIQLAMKLVHNPPTTAMA